MRIAWWLADVKTGLRQALLPLRATGAIERAVSSPMTSAVIINVADPRCPPTWQHMIAPGKSMLVPVLVTDDGTEVAPLHAYRITRPEPGSPSVSLGIESFEGVLWSAFCRDHIFDGLDESRVIATLASDQIAAEYGLDLDVTDCGRASQLETRFAEDIRVGDVATELASILGGPEWTIRIAWADDSHTRFTKTLEIGPEIGRRIESTIIRGDHINPVDGRNHPLDWSRSGFATDVQAAGPGSGESRLITPFHTLADPTVPIWEHRVSTPIDEESTLDAYAQAMFLRMRSGVGQWDLDLKLTEPSCPVPMVDFDAGDTVTMRLDPTDYDRDSWHGPARVIGWRMRLSDEHVAGFTPIFFDPFDKELPES